VSVVFWRGQPIGLELPSFIEASVAQCDPGMKGDTASGATKPATLETGAVLQVPLFIKEGDVIRVDTRTAVHGARELTTLRTRAPRRDSARPRS
jgi:elongation factor P